MEEVKNLVSLEEFKEALNKSFNPWQFIAATNKYKSVYRAIRRHHMLTDGTVVPRRPFNNRANSSNRKGVHSRVDNEIKKIIYGNIEQRRNSLN